MSADVDALTGVVVAGTLIGGGGGPGGIAVDFLCARSIQLIDHFCHRGLISGSFNRYSTTIHEKQLGSIDPNGPDDATFSKEFAGLIPGNRGRRRQCGQLRFDELIVWSQWHSY
jgi:hypothetical protein